MLIGLLLVGAAALGIWGIGSMLFREAEPLDEPERMDTPRENDEGYSWLAHMTNPDDAPFETDILLDPEYSSFSCNVWHDDTKHGDD